MSIVSAIKDVATLDFVPKEVADKRLEICRACPRFIQATEQCGICYCFMPLKVKLTSSTCEDRPAKW